MAMYSSDVINDVCAANDIVDIVSQYVNLKRSGKDYSGLCPFHSEKSPSFHVNRDNQLYYCFGCGAGGNLIQFVQRAEHLDFQDALKLLADRAGIALPENNAPYDDRAHRLREKIYEMNRLAARFYYRQLVASPEGKTALSYLALRKITPETLKTYGLGFAPDSFDAMKNYLSEQGYSDDDMLTAGFVKKKGDRVYDRFRNRVMFPIINVRGKVIGFGGRIMSDEPDPNGFKPPKYLNSAQTPVFDKGGNLFSLNLAKNSGERSIILCEGYMDVITVYQAGVHNITATLGTAVTEDQARLLKKYASEVILCYDSDDAGQKATMRAIDIMQTAGLKTRVMRLKGAKDPDEYIKSHGIDGFRQAVSQAVPSTEYKLSLAKRKYDLESADGKVGFISEVTDVLSGVDDPIEVDAYLKSVSQETDISKRAIAGELNRKNALASRKKRAERQPRREIKQSGAGNVMISAQKGKLYNTEKTLIRLITGDKKLYLLFKEQLSPEDITDPLFKRFAEKIFELREAGKEPDPSVMISELCASPEELSAATSAFFDEKEIDDREQLVKEYVRTIRLAQLERRMAENPSDMSLRMQYLQLKAEQA